MATILSLFENTFVSPHASALTSFLDIPELGALAATSKACCDIALYQLNRYLEDFFPPIHPFTEDTHKVRSVLQQVEASVPLSATNRSRMVGRRFFTRFTREYPDSDLPAIDQQSIRDKSFIGMVLSAWNNGLKHIVVWEENYWQKAQRLGIEDLWNLVQTDAYACTPEEDLDEYDFPVPVAFRWPGSNTPHVRKFWARQFPKILSARLRGMTPEDQGFAVQSMTMAVLAKLSDKIDAIVKMPETTSQEIIEKAALLREAVAGVLGVGLLTRGIARMDYSSQLLICLSPVLVYFTDLTCIILEENCFKDVPLLPVSVTELSLAYNSCLRGFAHLARLTNLQKLDLSSSGLEAVPPQVCAMSHLQHLDLSDNGLVALPEELSRISGTIDVSDNPLIFIPSEVLRIKGEKLINSYGLIPFYEERLSDPASALGRLYQCFVKPIDQYDEEKIREAVNALTDAEKNWLFSAVCKESGGPVAGDNQWGRDHAFDDLIELARAVKKTIGHAYRSLPIDLRLKVTRACCGPRCTQIDPGYWNSCLADAIEHATANTQRQAYLWPVDRRHTTFLQSVDDLQRILQCLIDEGNNVAWRQNMHVLLKWRFLSMEMERLFRWPGIFPHATGVMQEAYKSLRTRFSEVMKEKAAAAACRDIFLKAWKAGGSPNTELGSTEEKIDFGIRALTSDPAVLEKVIKAKLHEVLESLSQDLQHIIYHKIYNRGIGVSPEEDRGDHLAYGRLHALDDTDRLFLLILNHS